MIEFNTGANISEGRYGNVYMISDKECLKIIKTKLISVDEDVLKIIQRLSLNNFYQIYRLLYNQTK